MLLKKKANTFIVLILISLIFAISIGCAKQNRITQIAAIETTPNSLLEVEAGILLEEQIRDYDEELVFLFQMEGNFTGSGNKEILAFYKDVDRYNNHIEGNYYIAGVYCFVCDARGEEILDVYKLPYRGIRGFNTMNNLDKIPMESLGNEMRWLDNQRFGFMGDLNGNNLDEIYIHESADRGHRLSSFEFDEKEFANIMRSEDYIVIEINDVNQKEKIITVKGRYFTYRDDIIVKGVGSSVQDKLMESTTSYQWNAETGLWVEISKEEIIFVN